MTDEQKIVWERLKHVPKSRTVFYGDIDINSSYPSRIADTMISFTRNDLEAKGCVNIRVVKSR